MLVPGDSLAYGNDQQFSTIDQDNDSCWLHCSVENGNAGWWYGACHNADQALANPTGQYLGDVVDGNGIYWYRWKNSLQSLKTISMKIRPSF